MDEMYLLRQEDLVDNPTARVPICLVLDVSGSMDGKPIAELNLGVKQFYDAVRTDDIARYAAEICIVAFGQNVSVATDFMSIDRQDVPSLIAGGLTPLGEAVEKALDLLELRKNEYKRAGVDYFQPWLVIMTDGAPTDDISGASQKINLLVSAQKLSVFPIAIGESANMATLAALSPARRPLRLQGLKFQELFAWLAKSVSLASQSQPGQIIALAIPDWGHA